MVCDIPAGDGKIANLFLQCTNKYFAWSDHIDRCRRPCCRPPLPRRCHRIYTTSPWTLSRRRCSSEAPRPQTVSGRHYTDKKENQIFLLYEEIQNEAVAKSYMTNGLLIYGEIFSHTY